VYTDLEDVKVSSGKANCAETADTAARTTAAAISSRIPGDTITQGDEGRIGVGPS
jgi:hypothetical protein